MADPVVICLLGMHRSGTSAVARLANLLGVELGSENDMLEPTIENPRGYWEYRPFVELNNQILTLLGGDWLEPPLRPSGWENRPDMTEIADRARSMIDEDFADIPLWGWKDPRTCLTLPFWQKLLPNVRYILCVRDPLDVCRSLARRDHLTLAEGICLWLTYMRDVLQDTNERPRILVFYDDVIDNPARELDRMSQFIGRIGADRLSFAGHKAEQFIDRNLRHHHGAAVADYRGASDSVDQAIELARHAYTMLHTDQFAQADHVLAMIADALSLVVPEIVKLKRARYEAWQCRVQSTVQQMAELVTNSHRLVLADPHEMALDDAIAGHTVIPFLERDGFYAGPPPDDVTAIAELERLRRAGAAYLAFGWPAFWWLDYYAAFHQYVRDRYLCVIENDDLVMFDVRESESTVECV